MNIQPDFSGQVVIITGGSRGIGFATAKAFLKQGAQVAICALDESRLATSLIQLSKLGEVAGWRLDVSDYGAMEELVRRTLERFGRIDVLVNNAARIAVGEFSEQNRTLIDKIIDVNIKGALYATHAALPHMLKRGAGCVVNISSSLGTFGMASVAAYCASKFALVGFTEALGQEVKTAGVRVYGLTLSMSATDMQVQFSGYRDGMPPEIVAEQILLLAGPTPPIETGTCLKTYL